MPEMIHGMTWIWSIVGVLLIVLLIVLIANCSRNDAIRSSAVGIDKMVTGRGPSLEKSRFRKAFPPKMNCK
jgi:hypothetical protein